jgi:hypothetical protein
VKPEHQALAVPQRLSLKSGVRGPVCESKLVAGRPASAALNLCCISYKKRARSALYHVESPYHSLLARLFNAAGPQLLLQTLLQGGRSHALWVYVSSLSDTACSCSHLPQGELHAPICSCSHRGGSYPSKDNSMNAVPRQWPWQPPNLRMQSSIPNWTLLVQLSWLASVYKWHLLCFTPIRTTIVQITF